ATTSTPPPSLHDALPICHDRSNLRLRVGDGLDLDLRGWRRTRRQRHFDARCSEVAVEEALELAELLRQARDLSRLALELRLAERVRLSAGVSRRLVLPLRAHGDRHPAARERRCQKRSGELPRGALERFAGPLPDRKSG